MNEKEFDYIIKRQTGKCEIEIGVIPGSNKLLFIKVGQGGSIYGYESKYLKIAHSINNQYGYSVLYQQQEPIAKIYMTLK